MKAKTHPAMLATLFAVAVIVSAETAALSRHVERAGAATLACARAAATREFATFVVKSVTHAFARGAKS